MNRPTSRGAVFLQLIFLKRVIGIPSLVVCGGFRPLERLGCCQWVIRASSVFSMVIAGLSDLLLIRSVG